MRRSLRCFPLLALAMGVGCAHQTPDAAQGFDPPRAAQPAQTTFLPPGPEFGTLAEASRRNAEIFAATYGRYRCAGGAPPGLLRTALEQPRAGQILGSVDDGRISLQPGPERQTDDGRRTASHYRLRNAAGKTLAESESLLSEDILKRDDLAGENWTELFTDPAGSAFLIVEFRSGTGPRYHLFVRSGDAWQARMVYVPVREEPSHSPMHFTEPQVIGVAGGRVFCETDGVVYAFPFSELAELTDPAFGIG
jgi:hypothetical protein